MTNIPRGIQVVTWTNKDGSITTKYKVRITRKDCNENKNFDDINEAIEFLNLCKSKKGRELVYSITEEERKKKEQEKQKSSAKKPLFLLFSFGDFAELYLDNYVRNRPINTELQRRNRDNVLSIFRTICKTKIHSRYPVKTEEDGRVQFKDFEITSIKSIEINLYIRERLRTVKKVSIARELSQISNVFNKLQYFKESLADTPNPTYKYDKDLLKGKATKREFSITKEEEEKLFSLLLMKNNKQLFHIAKLSLMTSMRRSEVITLTHSQIKGNYIQLVVTKSNTPRKVYLDLATQEYIKTIPKFTDNDRLFKLTISGFEVLFRKIMLDNGLKHIHFHDLRRLSISRKIMEIGLGNSVLLSEIIGMQSVSNFEINHQNKLPLPANTQKSAMSNFGHSFSQTTKGYFNIPSIDFKHLKK